MIIFLTIKILKCIVRDSSINATAKHSSDIQKRRDVSHRNNNSPLNYRDFIILINFFLLSFLSRVLLEAHIINSEDQSSLISGRGSRGTSPSYD